MGYRILEAARRMAKSGWQHGSQGGAFLKASLRSEVVANSKPGAFPAALAFQSVTCDRTLLSITFEDVSTCLLCCMELDLQVAMINFHDCTAA